jgi:hypothetical protein
MWLCVIDDTDFWRSHPGSGSWIWWLERKWYSARRFDRCAVGLVARSEERRHA